MLSSTNSHLTIEMPTCQQCGRPAIIEYQGGLRFCLDCNIKFSQTQEMILYRLEREHNRLLDEIDLISGIPSTGGRYPERKPPVTMSGTFNSIRIDRSNVGVVNTGSIQSVQVSLAGIQQAGDAALAMALKEITEAVINSTELQPTQKNDAVQMLEPWRLKRPVRKINVEAPLCARCCPASPKPSRSARA